MLRIVLIVAAGCVLLAAALALTRGGGTRPAPAPEPAPVAEEAAPPPAPVVRPPAEPAPEPAVEPAPIDPQVQDDAAAVGLTTPVEPDSGPGPQS